MSTTDVLTTETPLGSDGPAGEILDAPPEGGRRARRLATESGQSANGTVPRDVDRDETEESARVTTPLRGTSVWVLASIALLALWGLVYVLLLSPFQEARQQGVLYHQLREQLSQQTAPLGGQITPGSPVALMSAPTLGIIDNVVVEGTASGDLMAGPGHRRDTVLPGQVGVAVVYGRASLFGGPFSGLANAHVGDQITVTTGQGIFTYAVTGIRRVNSPMPAPLASGAGRLTLVTGEGSGRLGALTPAGVLYVDASLKGTGQLSPPGRPLVVPVAERAMEGDPSALLPLALALPLLLGAVVFVAWSRRRWGGWQTWVIGVPVVFMALWLVTESAVQLLPNLL